MNMTHEVNQTPVSAKDAALNQTPSTHEAPKFAFLSTHLRLVDNLVVFQAPVNYR